MMMFIIHIMPSEIVETFCTTMMMSIIHIMSGEIVELSARL